MNMNFFSGGFKFRNSNRKLQNVYMKFHFPVISDWSMDFSLD